MANRIELQLSNGKTVEYEGTTGQVGVSNKTANGLIQLKEWGSDNRFYLNPEHIVVVIDHGPNK